MRNPSKEQEKEWDEQRRYHFARYCWVHQHESIQCRDGEWRTWREIFQRNEGITLYQYAELQKRKQRNREEKHETHSKQEGDQMTLL